MCYLTGLTNSGKTIMPTYEYECGECGHFFEAFQNMSDAPLQDCPECGQKSLRRLIGTGAGIIFKGSGFYCTDYRSDSYNQAAKKDTAVVSTTSTKSGSSEKSDSAKKNSASSNKKSTGD